MQIDWWTLFFQLLNGLILIWLLTRFLFRPIADMIATRQKKAVEIIDHANDIRSEAEEQRQILQSELDNLSAHKEATMESASHDIEKLKQSALQKAQLEANIIRQEAITKMDRSRHDAEAYMTLWANRQALDIAAKLMTNLPAESQVTGFIDDLANSVKKLPKQQLDQLKQSETPLKILSARTLTIQENRKLTETLAKELGDKISLKVSIKPDLIAGLEIVGEHFAVRNSFKSHLDRLAKVLVSDEH